MDKRGIILLIGLFLAPFVSAEIFVGQLNDVYNIGDEIGAELTLVPSLPSEDLLVNLNCGNFSENIYNNYHPLGAGEEGSVSVQRRLSSSLLGNLTGTCYLLINYGTEIESTEAFSISKEINLELELEFDKYNPGSEIILQGSAEKESGTLVEGFLEISIDAIEISEVKSFSNGEFSISLIVPEDAKSGEHNMSIEVYELGSNGERTNEATLFEFVEVSPILTDLEIIFNSENILPGEDFVYFVNTYDQAGDIMNSDISLIVYEPGDFVFSKKLIKPDNEQKMKFALNSTQGYWKIEGSAGELTKTKLFYLEEIEEIQTSLINTTLIVNNIGNVRYVGPLEISIGSSVEVKQLDLDIGGTKKFNLYAPEGSYLIRINDGNNASVLGNTFLTGNAIRVSDSSGRLLQIVSKPSTWFLIVLFFISLFGLVQGRKYIFWKRKKENVKTNEKEDNKNSGEVMHGKREKASVIVLKINSALDSKEASSVVKNSLKIAKEAGAKIYADGKYKIVLLSPTLTKKEDNESSAVKVAKRMEENLKEHNKKFKGHVFFGIGVNSGEIISESGNDGFKFASVGNVITSTKRIAQNSEGEVLLSEQIRRKVIETIKTEKIEGKDFWKIARITEREKHKDFLRKFLERGK